MNTLCKKHSVVLRGRRTSFSIEDPFWQEVKSIADDMDTTIDKLVVGIDQLRRQNESVGKLSNAIRLFVLEDVKARAGVRKQELEQCQSLRKTAA